MKINKQYPLDILKSIDQYGKIEEIDLKNLNAKKFIFWYPKDFSFICPTELLTLQTLLKDFESRNCKVFAVSCDTIETHFAWLLQPQTEGGIEGIEYPLISDVCRKWAKKLKNLDSFENVSFRSMYLLDEYNDIFFEAHYPMNIGRSFTEILRILDAKIYSQSNKELCQSEWNVGDKGIKNTLGS